MRIGKIIIFPIKSLDGVLVPSSVITGGGILQHDRTFAIYDEAGKVVNGKRTGRVHELRCEYDATFSEVRLWANGQTGTQFSLKEPGLCEKWLGEFFGFPVVLRRETEKGFPDDHEAFGPTITSEASLSAVQAWYDGLTLESVRRRFRTNVELVEGAAFCEDQLYGAPGELKRFSIGDVRFNGHNPCQRCVVPTRDPDAGTAVTDFQKKFMQLRKEKLPEWANAQRFNHFYRFAVNTSIPPTETGKVLRVGDEVKV